jgi:hypothetical protein
MLCTICANTAKIRASYASPTPLEVSRSLQARPTIMQSMESILMTWIENQVNRNSSENLTATKAKALSLFGDLKKDFLHEANLEFMASTGWFKRFKYQQQLHNIKFTRESAGSDALVAQQFPGVFEENITEGGYSTKQVFNVNETWLFWKEMPLRT